MSVGNFNIGVQFSIGRLVFDCNASFLALLNKNGKVYRHFEKGLTKNTVNEYGELVESITLGDPKGKFITAVQCRVVKIDLNLHRTFTKIQGRTFLDELRMHCCPEVPIKTDDEVRIGTEIYQVMRVDFIYTKQRLHHLELSIRRLDLT